MNLGVLDLPAYPLVMGVLEIDPLITVEQTITQGQKIATDGAAILDVSMGDLVSDSPVVYSHLVPILKTLKHRVGIPISISTSNPDIMKHAVAAGASMINDIRALTMPGALATAASLKVPVCIMHMQNDPVTKQVAAVYEDVVSEVYQYLEHRVTACIQAGIEANKIVIDPGFGFGKTLAHNLCLLRALDKFKALHCPVLVSLSHHSMVGQIIDEPLEHSTFGNITAAAIAIGNGADIIRTTEVKPTVDAIKVINAVLKNG